MTKAILFDLDETLLMDHKSTHLSFIEACSILKEYHIHLGDFVHSLRGIARGLWLKNPSAEFIRQIEAGSSEGLWSTFEGESTELRALREWSEEYAITAWSQALHQFGIEDKMLAIHLMRRFRLIREHKQLVFPDTELVLEYLRSKYELAIITNGLFDVQHRKIVNSGLSRYIPHSVISGSIGYGKPFPHMFDEAVKILQCPPDKLVIVGDGYHSDMLGGHRYGINTIHVNRQKTVYDFQPCHIITELVELIDFL